MGFIYVFFWYNTGSIWCFMVFNYVLPFGYCTSQMNDLRQFGRWVKSKIYVKPLCVLKVIITGHFVDIYV